MHTHAGAHTRTRTRARTHTHTQETHYENGVFFYRYDNTVSPAPGPVTSVCTVSLRIRQQLAVLP